jgi:hypothetical protein
MQGYLADMLFWLVFKRFSFLLYVVFHAYFCLDPNLVLN